jgi:hypothetical protein
VFDFDMMNAAWKVGVDLVEDLKVDKTKRLALFSIETAAAINSGAAPVENKELIEEIQVSSKASKLSYLGHQPSLDWEL